MWERNNGHTFTSLFILLAALAFGSCRKEYEVEYEPENSHQPFVTYMATVNGVGDNGYNDDAVKGVFRFVETTGTRMSFLQPHDMDKARGLLMQWLTENADRDSTVLILGSSEYAAMAKDADIRLNGVGARVLLFESYDSIPGIHSVAIDRYGASFLCGAMAKDYDVFVMAAMRGLDVVDAAVEAFNNGHSRHALPTKKRDLAYLSDNESGFAMPDSAYRTLTSYLIKNFIYNGIVFPLLGGSGIGVVRAMNDVQINFSAFIGMDVDQSQQSKYVPYSMEVYIGDLLNDYLTQWRNGNEWPQRRVFGMNDNYIRVKVNPSFDNNAFRHLTFEELYKLHLIEAIKEETRHKK